MRYIRVGAGSAYWGDMLDPAVELAEKGDVQYLGFDHLAELTLAILQRMKRRDASKGYIPDIVPWMKALLPITSQKGIKILTNGGGANPVQAGLEVIKVARDLKLTGFKVGIVEGDDILHRLDDIRAQGWKFKNLDTGEEDIDSIHDRIVSANVYIGADELIRALEQGADVVVAGRCSDNALYVAPIMHEFGWQFDHPAYVDKIASAITVGHVVECTLGCTGGMSNLWPIVKDSHRIGFPMAEVYENGDAVITKVEGSGGLVCEWTVKEHLLYEVHDPSNYIMPDGIADFTSLTLMEESPNRVRIRGVKGKPRPDTLKVCIGYEDGFIGEGLVFFPWPRALDKARWAEKWLRERIEYMGVQPQELRIDYVGINMLAGETAPWPENGNGMNEVGLRVVARTRTYQEADAIRREVTHLWLAGPVGTSFGVPFTPRPVVALWPTLVPREMVKTTSFVMEVM